MIVVTGGAGFIGSNLVSGLNRRGIDDIIVVDDMTRADKFGNIVECDIAEYIDKERFRDLLERNASFGPVDTIFHQGACSTTTEPDGRYMMDNNYTYSKRLFEYCRKSGARLLYASSAAVYGGSPDFRESRECERPLNVYGYSKLLFDQYVRRAHSAGDPQAVGLRYFNVYGPREQHKGRMASMAFHCFQQYRERGGVRLFEGSDGYGDGEQCRDFIAVEDVVKVNLFFFDHPGVNGIFNVGTGRSRTFNEIAAAVVNRCRGMSGREPLSLEKMRGDAVIEYIPFPPDVSGRYQSRTQADVTRLRAVGYDGAFNDVERGVGDYVEQLLSAFPTVAAGER